MAPAIHQVLHQKTLCVMMQFTSLGCENAFAFASGNYGWHVQPCIPARLLRTSLEIPQIPTLLCWSAGFFKYKRNIHIVECPSGYHIVWITCVLMMHMATTRCPFSVPIKPTRYTLEVFAVRHIHVCTLPRSVQIWLITQHRMHKSGLRMTKSPTALPHHPHKTSVRFQDNEETTTWDSASPTHLTRFLCSLICCRPQRYSNF